MMKAMLILPIEDGYEYDDIEPIIMKINHELAYPRICEFYGVGYALGDEDSLTSSILELMLYPLIEKIQPIQLELTKTRKYIQIKLV